MVIKYRSSLLSCTYPLVIFLLLFVLGVPVVWAQNGISGVKEGWGYPVVVIPPEKGWESKDGNSIKWALRLAEREISMKREGIRGHEVTFMFASVQKKEEIKDRLSIWRRMNVAVILSFAGGGGVDQTLRQLCGENGPAVLFVEGENINLSSGDVKPMPYLFALELPFFFKANAFAERASQAKKSNQVTLFSDIQSTQIARGARLTDALLSAKKIPSTIMWVPAFQQDRFIIPINEAVSSESSTFISWLEGMGTLSIWKSLRTDRIKAQLWYAGIKHPILLDASGIVLVDKDVLLERDIQGKRDISMRIRDLFNRIPDNPVMAAKAYALGSWAIQSYQNSKGRSATALAEQLSLSRNIPLMGENLDIDPGTHRPVSRRVGFLRIADRKYKSDGSVSVFSRNVTEK